MKSCGFRRTGELVEGPISPAVDLPVFGKGKPVTSPEGEPFKRCCKAIEKLGGLLIKSIEFLPPCEHIPIDYSKEALPVARAPCLNAACRKATFAPFSFFIDGV